MPTNLRRLGVYGDNLPVKRTRAVVASDFLIGGLMGQFERKYNKGFLVNNIEEFQEIFGDHVTSTFYGWDAVKGFFDNVVGVDAKLYVAAYVGNSGGSIDAVSASRSVDDDGAAATLVVNAGYQDETEYGVSGNRTAVKFTAATRFTTAAAATVAATGVSSAQLDSVIGIKVGDIVTFAATGGTPGTEYHKITAIDESAKTVSWSGDFSASSASLAVDDVVTVAGFTMKTYRKTMSGVETEVETDLGRIICTMEPEVTDFYAPNVHAINRWVKLTDQSSASTLGDRAISSDTDPVYLTSGADGTQPSVAADWDRTLNLFNDFPVRMLTNPETTVAAIHSAGEAYCAGRTDTPIWLTVMAENQTKTQLITAGNGFQVSSELDMVLVANWLKVEDPFATSAIAPARNVPPVGHVMGAWIRSIGQNGVHYIPAVKTNPLRGVVGIVGDQFLDDIDRTDIAENGVNLIQDLDGVGIIIRNFFTPSTDVAYQFANGLLMRNFIKVSAVESLQLSENQPNSINRIKEDKMAVLQFLYRLWDVGSTGNVPTGESFGRTQDETGNESQPDQHFEVKADLINNPQSSINAGERNIDVWFTFPAPAGSIKIGVGILLLS
jgi:hypothetical protein